jgi:hypothetical protein
VWITVGNKKCRNRSNSGEKDRPQRPKREPKDREQERLYEECEEALEEVLRERLEPGAPFRDYEQTLLEIAHEVVRRKLEKKLERIESGFVDRLAGADQMGTRMTGTAFERGRSTRTVGTARAARPITARWAR